MKNSRLPDGLAAEMEKWVTNWFDVESLGEFHPGATLVDELEDDEIDLAVRKFADKIWSDIDSDYAVLRPPTGEQPKYDWDR